MIQRIKDFLKTKPRLYDIVKRVKRRIFPEQDFIYDFFDEFSISHNRQVTFVQIGANDGLRNDPIREFIVRDRWSGILVEPLPAVFEMLKNNYANSRKSDLVFVNAAISSSSNDSLSFWTFSDDFLNSLSLEERLDYLRKASFDKELLRQPTGLIQDCDKILKEIKVKCLTLDSLVKQHWTGREIDLLVIDAEGHESSIIPSIDFDVFHPEAIYFESHNLGREENMVFALLSNHGYKITKIGGDSLAIQKAQRTKSSF